MAEPTNNGETGVVDFVPSDNEDHFDERYGNEEDSKSNYDHDSDNLEILEEPLSPKPGIPMLGMARNRVSAITMVGLTRKWKRKAKVRQLNLGFTESPVRLPDACHSMYWTKHRIVPLKNYHSEARASKDIEKFLLKPVVLFNPKTSGWDGIVRLMIAELQVNGARVNKSKAMQCLVHDEGEYDMTERLNGIILDEDNRPITDQGFVTVLSSTDAVTETWVSFCVFNPHINLGLGMEEVRVLCLVLTPTKGKQTKSAIEVGRTYTTLLADKKLQRELQTTTTPEQFAKVIDTECARVHQDHQDNYDRIKVEEKERELQEKVKETAFQTFVKDYLPPGKHLILDVKRRSRHYISDFKDGLDSVGSIQKIVTAILFLYFSLLLPGIALGVLNDENTHGYINARKVILSQAFGGLCFSLVGGQPMGVVRTTIPVVLFTKVIYNFAKVFHVDFLTFYALTGVFNAVFLVIYSLIGMSRIMAYCSRSTEEIVGIFISIAFIVDSLKYVAKEISKHWIVTADGAAGTEVTIALATFVLVFGTLFVGLQIYNFRYSPYLSHAKRSIVADYALVVSVLLMSFVGSFAFRAIKLGKFKDEGEHKTPFYFREFQFNAHNATLEGHTYEMKAVEYGAVLASIGLGFIVSILFFVEQNVAASMVNSPRNRLQKGSAYHLDLIVIALINIVMSVFGLPWVHPALPHSPLHVKALAVIEEKVEHGHVKQVIVSVIETRLTNLVAHVLIFVSLWMIPVPLEYIPTPVLYGLLLFLGISSLDEFQLYERILLLFTEQNQYPPHHYIRRVPQKVVHQFTGLQLLQLAVLCGLSFSGVSYLKMFFPFVIIALIPVRKFLIPKVIPESQLESLDGAH